MEPPNKGHVVTRRFVEIFFIQRLNYTGIIGIGMSRFIPIGGSTGNPLYTMPTMKIL